VTPTSSDSGRRPIVVLLVDDQPFVGMAVGRLLSSDAEIDLQYCKASVDAVAHANRVAPHVILQDLVMPDVDGLTLVGHFRSNPATAATPIAVLSSHDDAATRERAMAAGANDYLIKLPEGPALIGCIRRLAHGAAVQATPQGSSPALTAPAGDETLDRSVLAGLREAGAQGGVDLVTGLIDQFLDEAASLLGRLTDAARRMDRAAVRIAAHSLRGVANTMGARRLAGLSAQLEKQLLADPNAVLDLRLLIAIDSELGRVTAACLEERNLAQPGRGFAVRGSEEPRPASKPL
jgi:CheY-like chemotaxis protein